MMEVHGSNVGTDQLVNATFSQSGGLHKLKACIRRCNLVSAILQRAEAPRACKQKPESCWVLAF